MVQKQLNNGDLWSESVQVNGDHSESDTSMSNYEEQFGWPWLQLDRRLHSPTDPSALGATIKETGRGALYIYVCVYCMCISAYSGQTQWQLPSVTMGWMLAEGPRISGSTEKPGSGKETTARQNGVRFEGFTVLDELVLQVTWLPVSWSRTVREGEI